MSSRLLGPLMVICEVFIANLKSKSAYWHFNTALLLDAHFREVSLNVSRVITKSMKDLEIDIVELQSTAQSTGNGGCVENLKSKKAVLADLLGSRAQGGLVRS